MNRFFMYCRCPRKLLHIICSYAPSPLLMRDQDLESSRNFSFKCHDDCSYPIINVLDVAENLGPVDREAAVNAGGNPSYMIRCWEMKKNKRIEYMHSMAPQASQRGFLRVVSPCLQVSGSMRRNPKPYFQEKFTTTSLSKRQTRAK